MINDDITISLDNLIDNEINSINLFVMSKEEISNKLIGLIGRLLSNYCEISGLYIGRNGDKKNIQDSYRGEIKEYLKHIIKTKYSDKLYYGWVDSLELNKNDVKITSNDFDNYGDFSSNLFFVNHFGKIPSHFRRVLDSDSTIITNDILCVIDKYIGGVNVIKWVRVDIRDESSTTNHVVKEPIMSIGDELETIFHIDCDNAFGFIVEKNNINFRFINEGDGNIIKTFLNSVIDVNTIKREAKSHVSLIVHDGYSHTLEQLKTLSNTPIDFNKHYNNDFMLINENINKFIDNDTQSGLVILHGEPGSGKTNYIRHLTHEHNRKFIILNNSLMNHISEPSFMNFILKQKGSVLILEDCEQLLKDRSENMFNNGISNILNMTDGLFSDILNIKIIATFNSDLKNVDKALLRNGRLVEKYNFSALSIEKTNNLLKELGHEEVNEGLTLANIYNRNVDKEKESSTNKNKIGF